MLNHRVDSIETSDVDGLHLCPICRKLFLREKLLFKHIVAAHSDGEYMSYNLQAEMYQRWKERLPRSPQ